MHEELFCLVRSRQNHAFLGALLATGQTQSRCRAHVLWDLLGAFRSEHQETTFYIVSFGFPMMGPPSMRVLKRLIGGMARTERPMARYQDKISDVQGAKHSYELLGVPIGEKCLPQLLGTSRNRLHKCMQGCPDTRYGNKTGLRIQPKTDSVDAFLLSVYISQGQCLPDRCP